jgi:hypothetical protein
MLKRTHLSLAIGLLMPVMAQAQSAEPPAAPAATPTAAPATTEAAASADTRPEVVRHDPTGAPADGCELHIWPAERMSSVTTGLLGGGLLDSALHANRDTTNRTLMASALDSPSQLDDLTDIDLRNLLKLTPGTTIITHATPVERHTMNKIKERRAKSDSKCYSELIVADLFYHKAAIYGRSLRALFMLRDFADGEKIKFEFKGWGGNGLKLFPPKDGEDSTAALAELNGVFQKDLEEYSKDLAEARKPPLKG